MKKLFLLFFIVPLFFTMSCEKETELSEYVIGDWESQEINMGYDDDDNPVLAIFSVEIKTTGKYLLSATVGNTTITCPEAVYTVDNGTEEITIEEPNFSGQELSGDPIMITFLVIRDSNDDMIWQPANHGSGGEPTDDGPPTIYWTRK